MSTHPLRGPLFENAVVVEALKHRFNRGLRSNLSFFRDTRGLECDLLYENGNGLGAIEIKSGATIASDYFDALNRITKVLPQISAKAVVYGGTDRIKSGATIASDYFDALNRITKVLPQISAKAVVYGGTDRQSRRDGEVVPLADLVEVLERFDRGEGA